MAHPSRPLRWGVALLLFPFLSSGCQDILTSVADAPASVEITPSEVVINEGEMTKLAVQVFGQAGQLLEARPESFTLQWQNSDTTVFSLDGTGAVTALAPGEAEVTVTVVSATTVTTGGVQIGGSKLNAKAKVKVQPVNTKLVVAGGQDQTGAAGARLADSLAVRAVDQKGNGVSGVQVDYAVVSGAGQISPAGVRTDQNGYARAAWTLGGAAGKQSVSVSLGGKVMLTFNATATAPTTPPPSSGDLVNECSKPGSGWIWCDDFEQDRLGKYFEYNNAGGNFTRAAAVGMDGSYGMRARWNAGQVSAGVLHLAFGKTPDSYVRPVDGGTAKYREVYWRMFVRYPTDWTGGGADKLSRAQSLAGNWAQAMVAHVWSGGSTTTRDYLMIEPASGTSEQGALRTTGYNDTGNFRWLGSVTGKTPIFAQANLGVWRCVEARARLNDAGQSNGVFEMWVDGKLEAQKTGLNWVGSYADYGINTIFIENYWNNGSPKAQERYFDRFVVSTQPIGCGGASSDPQPGPAPAPTVGSVSVLPSQAALTVGQNANVTAGVRDTQGNVMTGKTVTWSSNNAAVARVTSTGALTARIDGVAAGNATVTATVDGKSATVAVTVSQSQPQPSKTPWVEVDFAKYNSTAELMADTEKRGGPFLSYEDITSGQISLDTSTGYGSSTKSMKYTFPNRSGDGGRCNDYSISRMVGLPQSVKEVWVEVVAKFSGNFSTGVPTSWACSRAGSYKFVFGMTTPNGRFGLYNGIFGNQIWDTGYPGNGDGYRLSRSTNWDGKWHRYRFHWKTSSSTTARDGIFQLWIDDELVVNETAVAMNENGAALTGIYGIALGRNINLGPSQEQSVWWGAVRAWNTNPGW